MSDAEDNQEEFDDGEQVLFRGPMYGREANLKKNPRLVQAGLISVKRIISSGLARRAHTILIEPKGPRSIVRYVIDGIPYVASQLPGKMGIAVVQMVKLLAGLDVQSRVEAQSGGILAEFDEDEYRLLVETTPVRGAVERLKIRVENVKESWLTPGDVGFPDDLKMKIREMTEEPNGVILACGMPESGVTSLSMVVLHCIDSYLYSVFSVVDTGDKKLINVTDVETGEDDDLEIQLDRILRQEGDAVYVGKVSGPEQAELLFQYSDRLCLIGEIESRTPAEAVRKLVDWVGLERVLPGLRAVISQKLIRRLCEDCRQAYRPDPRLLKRLGLPRETTVLYRAPSPPSDDDPNAPSVAELCADCNGMPYHGRVAAYEMFEMTPEMKEVIAEGGTAIDIRRQMVKEKQRLLQQDALRLVVSGVTSLEELKRAFASPKAGRRPAKRRPVKRKRPRA